MEEGIGRITSASIDKAKTAKDVGIAASLAGVIGRVAPVYVGGIPLYLTYDLQVGWSDRTLKYRSSGLLFLAHQKGEYDGLAIRVQFKLHGPSKDLMLQALNNLRQFSRARTTEILEEHGEEMRLKYQEYWYQAINNGRNESQAHEHAIERVAKEYGLTGQSKALDWSQMQQQINATIAGANIPGSPVSPDLAFTSINPFEEARTSVGRHKPIPFVSRTIVLRNCYIETFTITNKAENKDVYNCEIMVRKYIDPGDIESILTGHHWGLQETDKVDQWNIRLNTILRLGNTAFDVGRLRVSSSSWVSILDLLAALPTNYMILKPVTESLEGFANIFSPNPGYEDLNDYTWEEVIYNGRVFPFVDEYRGYKFAFDKMITWRRSLSGKNEMNNWIRLTIFDEDDEIIFNEKIVEKLMYTVEDMKFYFRKLQLLPTSQNMKMMIHGD